MARDVMIVSENPFIGHYEVPIIRTFIIRRKPPTYGILIDENDKVEEFYDIEQNQRSSLFKNKEFADKIILQAKPTTCKLFLYIVYYLLRLDQDFVNLKPNPIQEVLSISRNSLYLAIAELKTFRLIANGTKRNIYFINPEYIFNGNRIDYLKVRRPDKIRMALQRVKYL